MTRDRVRADECPPWSSLARFVAEGGPWPVEHLRTCRRCSERRLFLEELSVLGADAVPDRARPDCPDVELIVALVEGDVDAVERSRIAAHIADCEACAALLRELVALQEDDEPKWELRDAPADRAGPVATIRPHHASAISSRVGRAAAVLAAIAALATVYLMPFPPVDSGSDARWRGPAPRIGARVEWQAGAAEPTLSWQVWPGADGYRVRMWDETGAQRFERHVADDETLRLSLSPERVANGEILLWQLDALESGEVTASSGPVELVWGTR